MTVHAQSRAEAFDIAQFFAPEIIDPTKSAKKALVYYPSHSGNDRGLDAEMTYGVSKIIDHPIICHYFQPWLNQVLPRGIPWHDFPVVSAPFYSIYSSHSKKFGSSQWAGVPDSTPVQNLLEQADVIVIADESAGKGESAYELAYLLEKFGRDDLQVILPENGRLFSRSVAELKRPMSAEMRFDYSYLVNFTAIAMKALKALGADEAAYSQDENNHEVNSVWFSNLRGTDTMFAEPVSHPLALQWLYRLRAIGKFDVSYASESDRLRARLVRDAGDYKIMFEHSTEQGVVLDHSDGSHTLVYDEDMENSTALSSLRMRLRREGIAFSEVGASRRTLQQIGRRRTDDGVMFFTLDQNTGEAGWRGTGKYAPLPVSDKLARAPLRFLRMRLVDYDSREKTISLSDKGHRFLDMLHPDCEDPDVLLRWRGEDGHFKCGVQQSCDDWIMRFFSKMKTRINEI